MTQREIVWMPWDGLGMEHLSLRQTPDGNVRVESVVLGVSDGQPFSLRYRVEADGDWRTRRLSVDEVHAGMRIDLLSDGNGNWKHADGASVAELAGCIDVDVAVTPFTNTLPIRRLNLQLDESREIAVVYINAPSLEVSVERQRYTCLEPDRRYRFENVDGSFTADLPVDGDGVVIDYPGLFRRVTLRPARSH